MKYPIRFVNTNIPTNHCNLRCSYCYIGQTYGYDNKEMYEGGLQYSFDHMKRCLTIERFGGVCLFNLCASGETLLFSKLPEIVEMLLGLGHWVSIVTNLTIEKTLNKILQLPKELLQYTFFKCSFHYLELKRLNLLDIFFYNVELLKQKGIAFTVELTVNDETIPFIDEIKTVSMQRLGALPHVIESRNEGEEHLYRLTKLPVDEHQKIWGSFESPLFNYQQKNWDKQITNFCYAGDWRISLEINDGSVHQCDCIFVDTRLQNIFEIDGGGGYPFTAIGGNCPLRHCYAAHYQSCFVNAFVEYS